MVSSVVRGRYFWKSCFRMVSGCFRVVSGLFQNCFRIASELFQNCFRMVSGLLFWFIFKFVSFILAFFQVVYHVLDL